MARPMRIAAVVVAAALHALAVTGAVAAEPLPLPDLPPVRGEEPAAGSLARQIEGDPDCRERTNGCEVCLGGNGRLQCSTPGIACQPSSWRCSLGGASDPLPGPSPRL